MEIFIILLTIIIIIVIYFCKRNTNTYVDVNTTEDPSSHRPVNCNNSRKPILITYNRSPRIYPPRLQRDLTTTYCDDLVDPVRSSSRPSQSSSQKLTSTPIAPIGPYDTPALRLRSHVSPPNRSYDVSEIPSIGTMITRQDQRGTTSRSSFEKNASSTCSNEPTVTTPQQTRSIPIAETHSTGPITRLAPVRLDRCTALGSSSATIRPRSPRSSYGHCSDSTTIPADKLPRPPQNENKTNRDAATPIVVMHPPQAHPHRQSYTYDYGWDYHINDTRHPRHEDGDLFAESEKSAEDEDELNSDTDESEVNEEGSVEAYVFEDEEEIEPATLDLRGLFVREAVAAVQVFLLEQDKIYIESEFKESHRFVYIVTGWGKLSPGRVPKLKPAVEELLNSTMYKLKYQYEWTNNGEMEVDLIGRKTEADLRKRSEERMKQRQKNQQSKR
ncbi:cytoplasmic protein [Elysia marginata]|uniref:Cytoplasmic protein n=1 Tax=Elysia marginata TaxID=1093978 RepID=A0AAV4GLA8_9GAST|nr:cytoplasmic protein [Elysia marginata]